MTFKIRAIFIPTGREVFVTTRRFKTVKEAREFIDLVAGRRRFKRFRFIKVD